jgi:hypothetical protein
MMRAPTPVPSPAAARRARAINFACNEAAPADPHPSAFHATMREAVPRAGGAVLDPLRRGPVGGDGPQAYGTYFSQRPLLKHDE